MIIGADAATDQSILWHQRQSLRLLQSEAGVLLGVQPDPRASRALPLQPPPLMREHRLYQADWLMRFYGFAADEILDDSNMLSLEIDPKLAWALRHRDRFPLDVNRASREDLLRVPGFGARTSTHSYHAPPQPDPRRRSRAAARSAEQGLAVHRSPHHRPATHLLDSARLAERFRPKAEQLGFGF